MPLITLSTKVRVNTKAVLSVSDVRSKYLTGLVLPSTIDDSVIQHYIDIAVSEIESYLSLRLRKQIIKESAQFQREDWLNWGYLKTTYPVHCPATLTGTFGNISQVTYPPQWLSAKETNDGKSYSRSLYIIPSGSSGGANQIVTYFGNAVGIALTRYTTVPDYWNMEYVTGWDNIPVDLLNGVGLLVTANVLQIISDAIMSGAAKQMIDSHGQPVLVQSGAQGFGLGLSSKSISLDGLSQSTSTFVNGQTGLFGARLKQVTDNLNPTTPGSLMNRLYDQYGAIVMGVA